MFQVLYSPRQEEPSKRCPRRRAKRIVEFIDALGEAEDLKRYMKKRRHIFEAPT